MSTVFTKKKKTVKKSLILKLFLLFAQKSFAIAILQCIPRHVISEFALLCLNMNRLFSAFCRNVLKQSSNWQQQQQPVDTTRTLKWMRNFICINKVNGNRFMHRHTLLSYRFSHLTELCICIHMTSVLSTDRIVIAGDDVGNMQIVMCCQNM